MYLTCLISEFRIRGNPKIVVPGIQDRYSSLIAEFQLTAVKKLLFVARLRGIFCFTNFLPCLGITPHFLSSFGTPSAANIKFF